ncbi:cyclophilin-like domain-containing protein [Rhizobium gallicum]|uniref:Cyclophilin-like domain-containing protein n=1 Tax=Rhizobium gallicum TaxID=56730 RepID=A0A1L5NGF1_9HYPH|nr:cyclophilin-like domain-containing protein [Rhizobium gallicum]
MEQAEEPPAEGQWLSDAKAEDFGGVASLRGEAGGRKGAENLRGVHVAAALSKSDYPFAMERGGDLGAARRLSVRRGFRKSHLPSVAWRYPLYPGGHSETELLFAYGSSSFASKMGALAGNHFLTIVEGCEQLDDMGKLVLWKGAQPILFEALD